MWVRYIKDLELTDDVQRYTSQLAQQKWRTDTSGTTWGGTDGLEDKSLCSEHEGNQTGAADPWLQNPGQYAEWQIPGEIRTDTLTLFFFTLSVNEHMMHKVRYRNEWGGIIPMPRFPVKQSRHRNVPAGFVNLFILPCAKSIGWYERAFNA